VIVRYYNESHPQAFTFISEYYHKIFIFAVLERCLHNDCETECSYVYLMNWSSAWLMSGMILSKVSSMC